MQFTNVGLLNNISKRLATSNSPGILNATGGINNMYTQDTTLGGAHISDLEKQQRFDEHINNLLFGGNVDNRYMRLLNGDNSMDRQQKAYHAICDKPVNQKEIAVNNMARDLQQTAVFSNISEPIEKPVEVITPPDKVETPKEVIKESHVAEGFDGFMHNHSSSSSILLGLLVVFVLYLIVQIYVSQKRLEMLMDIYAKEYPLKYKQFSDRNRHREE